MAEKEYIIFCDESVGKGKYYSNFYGGLIVGSSQYERITRKLNEKKRELNFFGEVKWQKVTERYLEKYVEFIKCFFEEVVAGNVKVRIMFSQNAHQPQGLTNEDHEMGYFKLYYQFIKHGFGLSFVEFQPDGTNLRLYFDQFPDTKEKADQFKGYLLGLNSNRNFRNANIILLKENITEVRSHDHVLLQCLDIVLGAVCFRLNDQHKEKPPGQYRRGKRTVAKENLYKIIREEICKTRANFNIGESTGLDGSLENRWHYVYSHWKFQAKETVYIKGATKGGQKKKRPTFPT
jgi:hypothetical protein